MKITANDKEIIVPYIECSLLNLIYGYSDSLGSYWICDTPSNIEIYYKFMTDENWCLYIDMDIVDDISIDDQYIYIEFENHIYKETIHNSESIRNIKQFLRQRKLDFITKL